MNQKEIAKVLGMDKRIDGYKDEEGCAHFMLDRMIGFSMQEKKGKRFDIHMFKRHGYDLGEYASKKEMKNVTLDEALLGFVQFRRQCS